MSRTEEAKRLLEPMRSVFLVTGGGNECTDARIVSAVKSDGLKTVWMLTGKSSDKYRELSGNPRCMLYVTDLEDTSSYLELRLWGSVELLDDAASRSLAWRDDYTHYFPGGKDDPNLCVVKFTAESATLQTQEGKELFAL